MVRKIYNKKMFVKIIWEISSFKYVFNVDYRFDYIIEKRIKVPEGPGNLAIKWSKL